MPFPAPIKVSSEDSSFGQDAYGDLLVFIEEHVKFLKSKTRGIREELMPRWVRIYRGVPAEATKTFPWPGASNLVIQVAATHADELLSRVMAIYANDPLFVVKALADFDSDGDQSGVDQSEILQSFIQDAAYEPEELDLYRTEEVGFSSAIRYGTGVFKFPWEYVVEQQAVYIGGGTDEGEKVKFEWADLTKKDGPAPTTVSIADWGIDPRFTNLADADFKFHTLHLDYYQMMERAAKPQIFSKNIIEQILEHPDAIPEYRRQQEEQKQLDQADQNKCSKNYDLEECWFTYRKDGKVYRMIAYYHLGTNKVAGCIFNPYPENEEPFEDCKLAYDEDTYFGYGFCEMLESYQREVSTTHNWRVDNRHFATTGVGRVNKNSKLASIIQLYPGVFIPADEGEVEPLQFGTGALQYGTEDEQLTLALAKERSGVDPAVGGAGGGTVNSKKNIYSAQGTSVVMQSQNNRNNLRMSDMRSCHVRMGRKLLRMYSHFGIGKRLRMYGDERGALLKKALENYKSKRLGLVIKPATASQNKEMEKQNDILLSATLERLYASDLQMMQMLAQPGMPPEMSDLIKKQFKAKNALMSTLLRNFGHEDISRLLAVPDFLKKERDNVIKGAGNSQGGGNPQAASQVMGAPQGSGGVLPVGAGQTGGSLPQ